MSAASIDDLLADIKVVDADTHVIEPYDLWTSRMSVKKWGDLVPHVVWHEGYQREVWVAGDEYLRNATSAAQAGFEDSPPVGPRSWDEIKQVTWHAQDRLDLMTQYGIHSAVLYPNVPGFGAGKFTNLGTGNGDLGRELFQAYNDFLTEFCSTDPDRYIGMTALPFWDLDLTIAEMERCKAMGHRGVIFSQQPEVYGCPALGDSHWDRLWAAAQEMELPVNFHVGSAEADPNLLPAECGRRANYASVCGLLFMGNSRAIATMIGAGVCHRFPDLKIISVESGIGWIPFALQAFDWMWKESAVTREHPEYDLLPSEYFRRQMYGCFWFEGGDTLAAAIDYLGDESILYETDFPHPTSMTPGPASTGLPAKEFIAQNLSNLSEQTLRRVLHDNAAKLYKLA